MIWSYYLILQALENRTLDSKREMDILTALDEMRSLNARHAQVDPEAALAALKRSAEEQIDDLEAEDEALVREMVLQQSRQVKRLQEDEDAARPPIPGGIVHRIAGPTIFPSEQAFRIRFSEMVLQQSRQVKQLQEDEDAARPSIPGLGLHRVVGPRMLNRAGFQDKVFRLGLPHAFCKFASRSQAALVIFQGLLS